jgi:hypothetical protein
MARLAAIGALVVFIRVLPGCGSEVEIPAANSASSGDDSGPTTTAGAGGSGAASSGSTSGGGGGAVAPTCPGRDGDPFASGMASMAYSHSSDLVFDMLASTDPNIWDLTYRNGELHAVVLSAEADEVARVEADGTVKGLGRQDPVHRQADRDLQGRRRRGHQARGAGCAREVLT